MVKPVLLIYRQQSEGIGRLLRCLALARSLSRHFRPVILNNGVVPAGIEAPAGVSVVQMPPRSYGADEGVVSIHDAKQRQQFLARRREFILQQYSSLKPAVLMIDTFPFGDITLQDELVPLLEQAKNSAGGGAHIFCSLQDIQTYNDQDTQTRDDRTARLLEQFFDAVLVHTDPVFARLEEFFQPKNAVSLPVYYTGFLLPGQCARATSGAREERMLVSAGSGVTGMPLFRAAIEAHRLLWEAERLPMTIVTGPLLPRKAWAELQWHSRDSRSLTIKRSVPTLGAEMRKVRWSVSQCGYNTAAEVMASRASALFVPSNGRRHKEQVDRARRLVHWGVGRLLVKDHLNSVSLANEMSQLVRFVPRETGFNLSGSANTVKLIEQLTSPDFAAADLHAAGLIS